MTIISQLEVVFGRQNCKQWFTFELAHQSPSFNCVNLAVKYCGENATWVGKILLEHSTKERGHMGPFLFMSLRSCCNAGAWWRLRSRNDRCRHNKLIGIANGKQSRVAKSRVLFSWLKFTVSGRKTPAARLIYSRRVGGGCHRPDRHKCLTDVLARCKDVDGSDIYSPSETIEALKRAAQIRRSRPRCRRAAIIHV